MQNELKDNLYFHSFESHIRKIEIKSINECPKFLEYTSIRSFEILCLFPQ
jgi:hypothetical protein